MSTLFLISRRRSFSSTVGGGVPGRGDGTDHGNIVQGGFTIKKFPLFMPRSTRDGDMITGTVAGRATPGIFNRFLTINFNKTGAVGKEIDIGKSNKHGVSRVYTSSRIPERPSRLGRSCPLKE
jgi:hypothetical protein